MERARETYFSTFQPCPRTAAWLPRAYGHQGRPSGSVASPRQGPQAAVSLTPENQQDIPVGRLTVRREFLHAAKGAKAVRPGLVMQARTGLAPAESCRAGFTATKKVGGAVQRNRAKRRLREAARLLLPLYGRPGVDYVFIARGTTGARDWPHLLDDVKSALLTLARPASDGRAEKT
tara:strand:+ start:1983 stop:2513 length:531 start_codon:yes stop_codon:yes gene_type:complete